MTQDSDPPSPVAIRSPQARIQWPERNPWVPCRVLPAIHVACHPCPASERSRFLRGPDQSRLRPARRQLRLRHYPIGYLFSPSSWAVANKTKSGYRR
jgi:hypothetical protein